MSPISQAILSSGSFDPKMTLAIAALLVLSLRGWLVLHGTLPARFPRWRLFAFAGGLVALWLAIASPLDAFSSLLLSAQPVVGKSATTTGATGTSFMVKCRSLVMPSDARRHSTPLGALQG
jgi:hypothetical protein